IVAAGEVSINSSDSDFGVARYNPDGSLDTTFNQTGKATVAMSQSIDRLHDVALQPDNKVILAGQARRYYHGTEIHTDFALARFKPDGPLDNAFNKTGKVTTKFADLSSSSANAVFVQPDGKVVAVGWVNFPGGAGGTWAVARYNADGSLDRTFDGDGLLVGP